MSHVSRAPLSLVAGLAVAALLAGCATASEGDADVTTPSTGTQSIEHAHGTTDVPLDPQRIVVLEPVQLDTAVALDIVPVGAAVASNTDAIPSYLGVDEEIAPTGTVTEPSLEAIAALAPDLILGTEARHADLYDQLSEIAPTVFQGSQVDPWQDSVRFVGEVLGHGDEAQDLLDAYDERCASIAETYDVSGETASMVRPRDETELSIYGPTSFAGSTLECVGFTLPTQEWGDSVLVNIAPERIRDAAADVVFVTTDDVDDAGSVPESIVANGDAFGDVELVDTRHWVSGVGPLGGQAVLDDLEAYLESRS